MKFRHSWCSKYPPCSRTSDRRRENHCLIARSMIYWSNSRHSSIRRVIRYRHREYACTIHTNSLRIFFAPCRFSWHNILINILSSSVNVMFCIRLNQNDWPQQRLASTITCRQYRLCRNFYFWPIIFKRRYLDYCCIDLGKIWQSCRELVWDTAHRVLLISVQF